MSNAVEIGSIVVYRVSLKAKPKVGVVADIEYLFGGFRYKVYRKVKGRFLNGETAWEAMQNPDGLTVEDTRWVFQMWLKSERIDRVIGKSNLLPFTK